MKDLVKLVENNEELVVLKVNELTTLQTALNPHLNNNMEFITITKGNQHVLTITYKDGDTFSFTWGTRGHTLISEGLEILRDKVTRLLIDINVFIDINTPGTPKLATSYHHGKVYQLNLLNGSQRQVLRFSKEESMRDKLADLGYELTGNENNDNVGMIEHYKLMIG